MKIEPRKKQHPTNLVAKMSLRDVQWLSLGDLLSALDTTMLRGDKRGEEWIVNLKLAKR